MTRRSWIPFVFLGLGASCLSGCLFAGRPAPASVAGDAGNPTDGPPVDGRSPYLVHEPQPAAEPTPSDAPIAQAHYPAAPLAKPDDPPAPAPVIVPPAAEAPVTTADKAPADPQLVAALRCLLQKQSAEALELLQNYDSPSRDLLLTLLPLAARVGDGGIEHATPQETAVLLEQLRQLETVLRPRAALTLDRVCLCRKINGFGDCEPWPEDHVFQAAGGDGRGERMQVYVEVRNFTSRFRGGLYETSLAGVVEIRDFANKPVSRIDFPPCVDHSQTPRQDYFVNLRFFLPSPMPEGRYTLHVLVKDVLDPATEDAAAPRSATRTLDFTVGAPVAGRE